MNNYPQNPLSPPSVNGPAYTPGYQPVQPAQPIPPPPLNPPSPAALSGPQPGYEQQWQAYQTMLARQQGVAAPVVAPVVNPAVQPFSQPVAQSITPAVSPFTQSEFQAVFPAAAVASTKRKSKKGLFAAVAAVLLVGLGGTYAFAVYIPGLPQNVWSAGLGNTGQGLSQLNGTLTSPASLAKFDKYALDGSFKGTIPADAEAGTSDMTLDGTISLKADGTTSNASISGTATDSSQTTALSVNTIASIPRTGSYPDIYVQITGLDALGLSDLFPDIGQYDGKWISVPSSYLQQTLGKQSSTSTEASVSKADVAAFSSSVINVVNADVLTSSTAKSLLQQKSFVGHESKNGRDSYHYTAVINQPRAAAFCQDLEKAVTGTQLYKKLGGSSASSNGSDIQTCTNYFKSAFPASRTIDVWMDSQYRMLSALRFNPGSTAGHYVEFGETFDDLSKPSLYLTTSGDSANTQITLTVDRSTLASTFDVALTGTASNTDTLTVHAVLKPYTGTLSVKPPATSIDVRTALPALVPPDSTSSSGGTAGDDSSDTSDTSSTDPSDDGTDDSTDDGSDSSTDGTSIDDSGDYVDDPSLD